MFFTGILIAVISFLTIGVFHPIVIKGEYYFSYKIWPVFAVAGAVFVLLSLFVENTVGSSVLGVIGCSCFWSIKELFDQKKRVEKGWFPENPKRRK